MRHYNFEGASTRRPLAVLFLLLLSVLASPVEAHAAVEGRACDVEPTDDPIAYGDLITCELNPLGESDLFRFQGTTGEQIFITASRSSGGVSPCIHLFSPTGGAPFAISCANTGPTFTWAGSLDSPDATGIWTISIFDGGAPDSGFYTLVLDRLSPTSPAAEPVNYGSTVTGELNPIGDADLFMIGGGLGSTITIQTARLTGGVEPCVFLYDPDGGPAVASDCHAGGNTFAITYTMQKAGTHTVSIVDRGNNETGTFSLTLQCIAGDCPDLHTLTITAGPAGAPNPVRSANITALDVTAIDSSAHALTYAWTASCPPVLASNGAFSSESAQDPTWTAPANPTGIGQTCTIHVTVSDGHGLSQEASYEQGVHPVLPPDITVTPLSLDFGSVTVGTTSDPKPITIKNDGTTDDLLIKTITLPSAVFDTTADGCSNTTLTPGQSCTVSVVFKPGSAGSKSAKLVIPSNDPDPSEVPVKVALSGIGTSGGGGGSAPDITVTPASLDFGNTAVGTTSDPKPITITNDGTGDLLIKTITLPSAVFDTTADGCSNRTLTPGQSCTVSVVFKPGSAGSKSAKLVIPSNDPDPSEVPVKVALSGIGTSGGGGGSAPDITVTPASLDFGSAAVGSTSDPKLITITNDGTGDLLIKTVTLSAGKAFQKASDACSNSTLPQGESCTVSVVFKPPTTGLKSSTLSIPSNDPDPAEDPTRVSISGTGQ